MANILYANNAAGTLSATITNASTALTLNAGQGARFPLPVPPQVFYVTLTDAATQTLIEIVKVTAVSGDVFSITRAQDGTAALSWNAGDIVSQRTIRLELQGFENAAEGNFAALGVAVAPSTTLGITGTVVADQANAGAVGEVTQLTSALSPLTSGIPASVASVNLTPGDWDVTGTVVFVPSGTTVMNALFISIGTTPASLGGLGQETSMLSTVPAGTGNMYLPTPTIRVNATVTTSVFLTGDAFFSGGGMQSAGTIRARRVR